MTAPCLRCGLKPAQRPMVICNNCYAETGVASWGIGEEAEILAELQRSRRELEAAYRRLSEAELAAFYRRYPMARRWLGGVKL